MLRHPPRRHQYDDGPAQSRKRNQGSGFTREIVTTWLLSPFPTLAPLLSNFPTSKSLSFATTSVDGSSIASPSSLSGTPDNGVRSSASVFSIGTMKTAAMLSAASRLGFVVGSSQRVPRMFVATLGSARYSR